MVAIRPHFDRGLGVLAHRFEHRPNEFWRGPLLATDVDRRNARIVDEAWQWVRNHERWQSPSFWRTAYPGAPIVGWFRDLAAPDLVREFQKEVQSASPTFAALPIEGLGIIAGEPSGHGCIVFTADHKVTRLSRQTEGLWRRIAAHLVTGYRLVRHPVEAPDAVLTPVGKVLHREGSVAPENTEPLSEATRAIDRARGKLRRTDPEGALELWRGLVEGRWSLVDHCDHDGRRYVFAKRNAPEVRPWHSLTEREAQVVAFVAEGQPHKLVGYQLGISLSTVSETLVRARKKLGASSRLALVKAYKAARQEQEEP
jgi:DNA-binding CsgD family transcriptional regulator